MTRVYSSVTWSLWLSLTNMRICVLCQLTLIISQLGFLPMGFKSLTMQEFVSSEGS